MNRATRRVALIAGTILAVLAAFGAAHIVFQLEHGPVRQWAEDSYAGRVSAMGADSMRIEDVKGAVYTIRIAPTVQVRKGRDMANAGVLSVGEYVIISGRMNAAGDIEAEIIRIVSPDAARLPPSGATRP